MLFFFRLFFIIALYAKISSIYANEHFVQSKDLFTESLSHIDSAELHFFWTTGITPSDNQDYEPSNIVHVGGTEQYGHVFFNYVNSLLSNTPRHLIVRFVCDKATYSSNLDSIEDIKNSYPDRFNIYFIQDVEEKILSAFPKYKEILVDIFANATKGNPAITSDIYRLIGMYYGHAIQESIPRPIQLTYCDIDTFIYGMNQNDFSKLIESLFAVSPISQYSNPENAEKTFMLWRDKNINNLIKIKINELSVYRKWCSEEILEKLKTRIYYTKNLLTSKTQLHDMIKRFEISSENEKSYLFENICNIDTVASDEIVYGTGPGLTFSGPCTSLNLFYPDICTYAWSSIHMLEKKNPLFFVHSQIVKESVDYEEFNRFCKKYVGAINAAFFAKRLGKKHPLYLYAHEYLTINYPYTAQLKLLKNIIWNGFSNYSKNPQLKEGWLKDTYESFVDNTRYGQYATYRSNLKTLLNELGINPNDPSLNDLYETSIEN